MRNPLADYLALNTDRETETRAQQAARIDAWELLPPFERALATLLHDIETDVRGYDPARLLHFTAETPLTWARDLRRALTLEALRRPAEDITL
jgi:hypothetical protein